MVTEVLRKRYEGVSEACIVDVSGLTVDETVRMRRTLTAKGMEIHVVKNSLARGAFRDGALAPLGEVLQGPCALVTSADSLIEAAKVLVEAAKEFSTLKLKQAIIEGDPQLLTVEEVSKMKTRGALLGEVMMLISSPGRAVSGCLGAPQAKIVGCLKAMIDKAA